MQVLSHEQLKREGALWQGRRPQVAADRHLPSGWSVLDEVLGGGWPRDALTEIISESHHGLPLLLPLLERLSLA